MMRMLLVLVALTAGQLHAQEARLTPQSGFYGRTQGNGTMRLLFGRPRPFHVESHGYDRADGRFQLDQTIAVRNVTPWNRSWVMTTVAPDRYHATLSDAAGPVRGRTDGGQLTLRYRFRGPLIAHQSLRWMPDGSIDNLSRLTLLGLPVGWLHETITRRD